jgi:hypothetical protein
MRFGKRKKKAGPVAKVFMSVFFLMFLIPGLLVMGWGVHDYYEHYQVMQWDKAYARITSSNLKHSYDGEGGTTYRAEAKYTYTYNGQTYTGDRASLYSDENDNIGSFQEDLARRIKHYQSKGELMSVYVNPDDPSQSIISRDFRWGFFAFKFLFGLIFAAVGGGLFYATWFYKKKPKGPKDQMYIDRPWLENDKWQTPVMTSDGKTGMWFAVGFAVFWNSFSWFIAYVVYDEYVNSGNKMALIAMLFPVAGIWLIVWALREILEYKKYGQTPLTLDPFPGSIGGHVGGTIDLNERFSPDEKIEISLSNMYSYMSGSGDDRRRSERIQWEKSVYAHAEPYMEGTRLTFRFDIPEDADVKETEYNADSSSYYLWRLHVNAVREGVDLDRSYEIPVYKTAEVSRSISERVVESMNMATQEGYKQALQSTLPIRQGAMGSEIYYPALRNLGGAIGGLIFGAIFMGVTYFLVYVEEEAEFMGWAFGFIGGIIALCSLYAAFNSLRVTSDGVHIISKRTLFWLFPMRNKIRIDGISKVWFKRTSSQQTGTKRAKAYYKVVAEGRGRKKITLAEGIEGTGAAEMAVKEIKAAFNINTG